MDPIAIISISITIAGFLGGIVIKLCTLAGKFGSLETRFEKNEERDVEERAKNSVKFGELYSLVHKNEAEQEKIKSDLKHIGEDVSEIKSSNIRLEDKIDMLLQGRK